MFLPRYPFLTYEFGEVVDSKFLSLITQGIAPSLINYAEAGQQNRKHHFMTIDRLLSHTLSCTLFYLIKTYKDQ